MTAVLDHPPTPQDVRQRPEAGDDRPVVFFDGVCGLCDGTVSTLLKIDRGERLLFATLQGETAKTLPPEFVDLNSMVLREGDRLSRKSTAVGRTLKAVGGFWAVLGSLLLLVPRPLRDLGYTLVAKIRYRVWGKKETCRIPTPAERGRFLD
ncbi:MAG: DCC1-like thiol-disulfide oxidoreductase family protein [Planctomycetota bacterium]